MGNNAEEENYLLLSGIQHFAFCPRQWALIHIDGIWDENYLTAQGQILHEKVDDPWFNESRKGKIICRSMPIRSEQLKLQGVADIVELTDNPDGISVPGRKGTWSLLPVEYKRGRPKSEDCDKLQLCAQAICLEEMLKTSITKGEIFYGQIRRRIDVIFSEQLRKDVVSLASDMHKLYKEGKIPICKKEKHCQACSLINVCSPECIVLKNKVSVYIEKEIEKDFYTV